jgi:D-glycero-D-manno-heptose 1,7-bisphosphate phosphatase
MGIDNEIKQKAVFLDRDGVINKAIVVDGKPFPPSSIIDLEILDGVELGIEKLKIAGYKVFIVTNQPDVARGKTSETNILEINDYLKNKLRIDEVSCCFHDGTDECNCRKPKPGMILDLASRWNIDLAKSFLIGDRWRDILSAKNAGVKSILIDYNYDEQYEPPDFASVSFEQAINYILKPLNSQ